MMAFPTSAEWAEMTAEQKQEVYAERVRLSNDLHDAQAAVAVVTGPNWSTHFDYGASYPWFRVVAEERGPDGCLRRIVHADGPTHAQALRTLAAALREALG